MKKLLLSFLLFFLFQNLSAAFPKGVTLHGPNIGTGYNFMFQDSKSRIWTGTGLLLSNGYRSGSGFGYFDSARIWHSKSSTGIYTDALEFKNEVFIASYDGLYRIIEDSTHLNQLFGKANALAVYKDSVFVGTMGNGLMVWKDGHQFTRKIQVNGENFDTILSLDASGKTLWIGTSKGVLKYQDGQFSLHRLINNSINQQKSNFIRSVLVDGNGNIWSLNDLRSDTVSNIYIMLKGTNDWLPAMDYYKDQCLEYMLLPSQVNRLNKARNGTVLIGTYYGLIELSESDIHCFPVLDDRLYYDFNVDIMRIQNPFFIAMEDRRGDYHCFNYQGYFSIDRSQYDFENFVKSLDGNYAHAATTMDLNDIKAGVANDGTLFNGSDVFYKMLSGKTFTIPELKCTELLFNSSIWMSAHAFNDDSDRVSVIQYRQNGSDFAPGPVRINQPEFDSSIAVKYNKIWRMDKEMVDEFKLKHKDPNYTIPQAILDWPANSTSDNFITMAPFVDADLDGKYDPKKGDYPLIKGDRMLWWVFNDLIEHTESKSAPIGIQVSASCYAFRNVKLNQTDSDYIINRTLFFRYQIINIGFNTLDNMKVGIFTDPDIGYYIDDMASCDTVNSIGYAYNSDNFDEGPFGLGKNPPVIACKFLNKKMKYFLTQSNLTNLSGNSAREFNALLNNQYVYGDTIKSFANPYSRPFQPCQYSGGSSLSDTRFLMVSEMDATVPGASDVIEWSYSVFYNPDIDYLKENCQEPLSGLLRVQNWYNNNSFPSYANWSSNLTKIQKFELKIYPNPNKGLVHIESELEIERVVLLDVSGKDIMNVEAGSNQLSFPLPTLATGIYILKVITKYGTKMEKLMVE